MPHPTEATANKVSYLLDLDGPQTQIIRDLGEAIGDPRVFLREVGPLLSARRYRVLIWGIRGIGKTRAIRLLGASLKRPILVLDADQDSANNNAPGVLRDVLAFPPAPTMDPAQLKAHIHQTLMDVNQAISSAQARLRSADVSGIVLDTISALNDALWGDFALTEIDRLEEGISNRGGGGMSAQRAGASTVQLIKTTMIRLWRAGDYRAATALSDAPQAPGPYVVGALGHARSMPRIEDGKAVFGSHDHYEIKLGPSVREDVMGTVDFALGFGVKRDPSKATTAADRVFTFDDLDHPMVKGRLAEIADDPEERKIAQAAGRKGDLVALVHGLYQRRISVALEQAARRTRELRAK